MRTADVEITIPDDPDIPIKIANQDEIIKEFSKRKADMYAKYFGDKDYRKEYLERSSRYKSHEVEVAATHNYKTIEDYAEKEADEDFLLLDQYKERLERVSKYESGDTSVYSGTKNQISAQLAEDKEYITTRNHTFDQHINTRKDLVTLGKYGEKLPYVPKKKGIKKNIFRVLRNAGVLIHNTAAPVYRVIGKGIATPLHKLVRGKREATPFRNNWYHRMVARRNYFKDCNSERNPGHGFKNGMKARVQAMFKYKEGNEAVLRAGAADIRKNIQDRSTDQIVLENLTSRVSGLTSQILTLENALVANPTATNKVAVQQAISDKKALQAKYISDIAKLNSVKTGLMQTDAISDKEHAVASKEVTTLRTTAIKGVVKGVTLYYIGPKLVNWLSQRGKHTEAVTLTQQVPVEKQKWVGPKTKTEVVPIYENQIGIDGTVSDMIAANKGKTVEGFYSVYGGEYRPGSYTLSGNEGVTAIFKAQGKGGTGLSDTVGLQAPVLVDGTFDKSLLDVQGLLDQGISVEDLVKSVKSGAIDANSLDGLYVAVQDQYWAKLSDLTEVTSKTVQTGSKINTLVEVPGHYETYTEMIDQAINTTKVVENSNYVAVAGVTKNLGKGVIMVDTVADMLENLRRTTTNVKSNKDLNRDYRFDEDMEDLAVTKSEYKRKKKERDDDDDLSL